MDLAEGNRKAAREAFNRSLGIGETLAKAHPDVPDFQRNLSVTQCAIAAVDICDGDIAAAITGYRRMHQIMRTLADTAGAVQLY